MAFSLDDDERNSNASSENDQDELMEDADENEAEMEQEADAEAEDQDDENEDNDDQDNEDEEEETQDRPDPRPPLPNGTSHTSNPAVTRTSASPHIPSDPRLQYQVRPEALMAKTYDIVPTMAAPQSTSINAIAVTPDMRYWFTGGSDCYVRKYDGASTINGKTLLTVAQRHPFVDSVTKAGVLMSYWENEEPVQKNASDEYALSPVYSLAVHHDALWLLSGLESGAINLQSVRHDEGKRITSLQKHSSAVSVLTLSQDEKSLLSGSWDKTINDWDLNTGEVKRSFGGSGGQISAIEIRPASSLPVPSESGEIELPNGSGTFSSNNGSMTLTNGSLPNGINGNGSRAEAGKEEGMEDAPGSAVDDNDSLFGDGGEGSLFGDNEMAPSGGQFDNDDDEFQQAINLNNNGGEHVQVDGDISMGDTEALSDPTAADSSTTAPAVQPPETSVQFDDGNGASTTSPSNHINGTGGLPHAEELNDLSMTLPAAPTTQDAVATSDTTFLAASIDGTLRVWDRRQPNPIARIPPRNGVPPWCMGACWSPDGNFIYAGRRNGTVEEFSLHKGFRTAERTFKFPAGSGAVSAVRAMPNSSHLIWYVVLHHSSHEHSFHVHLLIYMKCIT